MVEKKNMRAASTSEHVELDVQNKLEAAYKDLIKAREDSTRNFEKSINEAHLDFEKTMFELNTESTKTEKGEPKSPLDVEREFVNAQFDSRKKHEAEFKEARETYEEKVQEVFANTDVKGADLRTLAEVSRIIWWFANVH